MDSISKVILFFIICIATGLGIGAIISKTQMVPTPAPTSVIQPVVADDQSSSTPVVPQDQDQTQTSVVIPPKPKVIFTCPVAPANEVDQWLAPVGPDYDLGKNYIPNHLVILENYVVTSLPTTCLNTSAAIHLMLMESAMKTIGLHLVVPSGYRTADYQEELLALSEAKRDKIKNPYPLVALPGHSEHQLGMAVDLVAAPNYTLDDFINTPEYTWLVAHSWEYGFIQSYPIGSESITGYSAESWHFRYVGIANAIVIHNQNITIYQYLKNLVAQTSSIK